MQTDKLHRSRYTPVTPSRRQYCSLAVGAGTAVALLLICAGGICLSWDVQAQLLISLNSSMSQMQICTTVLTLLPNNAQQLYDSKNWPVNPKQCIATCMTIAVA